MKCHISYAKTVNITPLLSAETNDRGEAITVSSVQPSSLTVSGDKDKVDGINEVYTQETDVAKIYEETQKEVQLDLSQLPEGVSVTDSVDKTTLVLRPEPTENGGDGGADRDNNDDSAQESDDKKTE